MDGWIFCVCSMFVFAVFALLLLTGDCGGSDDYDCIPGSLLAQRFRASPPQDFPPLYLAAPTWECSYPGYTYQQNQHTIPGKTSRKEVQELSMDVGSMFKWEISYITVGRNQVGIFCPPPHGMISHISQFCVRVLTFSNHYTKLINLWGSFTNVGNGIEVKRASGSLNPVGR